METGNHAAPFDAEHRAAASNVDAPPKYRWAILFAAWMAFMLSYVDRVAWSSVAASVGQSLGLSVSMLGVFVTAFYIGYVVANVAGGLLTDTIGARRTLTFALIPLGLSTFAFGFANTLMTGIALQVIMGLTAGADYAAGMKIIASWFDRERGLAMGIYGTATSLAVVISNATVPTIAKNYGWSNAFHLLGIVTFIWGFVCFWMLRDNPNKAKTPAISRAEVRELLMDRNLILVALAGFAGFWATVGFGAWGNALMTKQYGISPVTAGAILATFGVGAMVSKPLLGWIRDLLGPNSGKYLPIGCLLCFSALLVAFGRCTNEAMFYLIAPVLGAAAFGYTPLLYVLLTEASGTKAAGAASGFTNAIWQLGSVIAPMAVGAVYGGTHSFSLAIDTLAAGPLCGAIILCFLRKKPAKA
ncbi:MFS transporter [Paraburkholderia caribensis]|nr:MFS transporter [Paraburkholderia caribensis]